MTNMIGIGPFITIPALMTALNGPQAMIGWGVALLIAICDGMIWSELGAPLFRAREVLTFISKEGFGPRTFGPDDGLPVHLAVHPERPAGDCFGLHWFFQYLAILVARHESMDFGRDHRDYGLAHDLPSLSQNFAESKKLPSLSG